MTEQVKTAKYPKRLWLAGPAPYVAQTTVIVPNTMRYLKFDAGSLVVKDAEEEAVVRKALGDRVYDETPGFTEQHPRTGWLTTSQKAYLAHVRAVER